MEPLPRDCRTRQTPRLRVLTALAHRAPDRVPFTWGFGTTPEMGEVMTRACTERGLDWGALRDIVTDKIAVFPRWTGPPPPDDNTFTGIWGINLKRADYAGGHYEEFTDFPLAGMTSERELADYPWPDPEDYDYDAFRQETLAAIGDRSRAVQLHAGHPFEIYCWMTGLEEALVNLATQPELVRAALGHIGGFILERLRRNLDEIGDLVDIVFMADDLGGQRGLLLSRRSYCDLIQPVHAAIAETVRTLAPQAVVMHHSDGAVFDILPDLIDAGVQVLEAVQTDAAGMAPERLKETYGDRLAFHGAISVQQLLPHGTVAEVDAGCRRLVDILGRDGGYIAAPAHAIQVGTPPDNVFAMLRAILGDADYREALERAAL